MSKIKKAIKAVLRCIAKALHIYEPLGAAWGGYKYWKEASVKSALPARQDTKKVLAKSSSLYQSTIAGVTACLEKIAADAHRKPVYIFQYSYYTPDGATYISGGGERYATDLGRLIDAAGYQPVLIQCGQASDSEPWVRRQEKNIVVGIPCSPEAYPHVIENLVPVTFHIYSGFCDFGARLLEPNLIISHGITWDSPVCNANLRWISRILFSAQRLISVDTSTICFLRSAFSYDLAQHPVSMRYIPNYTDTTKYRPLPRPEDGKVKLVFPRRSAPERGFWLLADVLPKILDKYPQAEIEFIGFVHEKDMADALAKWESDYPGRVSHRLVKADDMPSVYQNADISLIPTLYSEGTSLSCIEAMACGNAVIATNIGGLPNLIINDYNGLLISPDSDELYTAICKLIDSPELRRQISRNALLISQYFSKTVWENRWKSILQEFLLPQ